jgi:ADP-ribosylation factor-like protein 3
LAIAPTRGFKTRWFTFQGIVFEVFDVGGQKSLRENWNEYLSDCAGVVWVIDSADRRRIYETGYELGLLLRNHRLKGVPILVMANKQDIATALPPDEVLWTYNARYLSSSTWIPSGTGAGGSRNALH